MSIYIVDIILSKVLNMWQVVSNNSYIALGSYSKQPLKWEMDKPVARESTDTAETQWYFLK